MMMIPFHMWCSLTLLLSLFSNVTLAARQLIADSLVSCMENSQIDPTYFNVVFDADSGAVEYDLSIDSLVDGYVYADVIVYAYGFDIITENIDFCSIGWKQFCPIYPGTIEIDSIEYISSSYVNMIPGIAYTFPDLDALVRVLVSDANGTQLACIQASFSNGKTVSHIGAKWATAVVAGIGLLVSAILSAFGNSNSASHISANAIILFSYFQSVVIISMLHVREVPPIASAWAENLAWSMGLIRIEFMQKIFRWYVQATGGNPSQLLTTETVSVLVQRGYDFTVELVRKSSFTKEIFAYLFPSMFAEVYQSPYVGSSSHGHDFTKRDSSSDLYNLEGTEYLEILRGIKRVGYQANIEPTSIACTGFTFFVLFGYVLIGLFYTFKYTVLLFAHRKSAETNNTARKGFLSKLSANNRNTSNNNSLIKGIFQRYIYIGFTQLTILSLWEFTQDDSPAVVVIAALLFVSCLTVMSWTCYRTLKFGFTSISLHNNPAAILYGDPQVLDKYGFFYTMFNAKKFWFGSVILVKTFVEALFVGLAQKSGQTQALAIFIIELAFVIYMGIEKPFLDKPTNIMNIVTQSIITLNSFFFLFFSELFGQPTSVGSVMGLIFFIVNAIYSLVLLIFILVLSGIAIFSKNPDARFAPAKDDRTSFQNIHNFDNNNDGSEIHNANRAADVPEGAEELFALGEIAKDHQSDWANEMYKLKEMVENDTKNSNGNSSTSLENGEKTLELTKEEDATFGSKILNRLKSGRSILGRRNSKKTDLNNIANGTSDNLELSNTTYTSNEVSQSTNNDTIGSLANFNRSQHQRTESNTPIINQHQRNQLSESHGSIATNSNSLYNNEGGLQTPVDTVNLYSNAHGDSKDRYDYL